MKKRRRTKKKLTLLTGTPSTSRSPSPAGSAAIACDSCWWLNGMKKNERLVIARRSKSGKMEGVDGFQTALDDADNDALS